ncbi:hypothetical protein ACE3L0_06055 [Lactobacillus johnsonii]
MIDNDERKGIIKKTKDDDFVIVRIDEKHVGDYFSGLAYEAGINMYCLQRKASEFHKVNDNNGNEQWQLGDVLVTNTGNIGLIVKNGDEKYCLMDIDPDNKGNYSTTSSYSNCYKTLADLRKDNREYWHKVNAKLVIE